MARFKSAMSGLHVGVMSGRFTGEEERVVNGSGEDFAHINLRPHVDYGIAAKRVLVVREYYALRPQ